MMTSRLSILSLFPSTAFPILLLALLAFSTPADTASCFSGIFSFGDSYIDAGNYLRLYYDKSARIRVLPYGMTYFHRPTGRFTDGRTLADFFSLAQGLPLQPPHLGIPNTYNVRQGVNFAVGGATVLDVSFFEERGIPGVSTNYSLSVQIGKFKELLTSLCNSESECREDVVANALFLVGQIGIQDLNLPLLNGRALSEAWTYVPDITRALISTIEELIKLGAKTLVVPGIFPNGCIPAHLSYYVTHGSTEKDDYDPANGCVWPVNVLSYFYNFKLQEALEKLRRQNPSTTIIYADYYNAAMDIIESPEKFGFDKDKLRVCCGGGGPYNLNESASCGTPGATVCDDPSRAVFWGRYHFTDAANNVIAKSILEGPNAVPPITRACPDIGLDGERAFSK